jgi:hypothetical protein
MAVLHLLNPLMVGEQRFVSDLQQYNRAVVLKFYWQQLILISGRTH